MLGVGKRGHHITGRPVDGASQHKYRVVTTRRIILFGDFATRNMMSRIIINSGCDEAYVVLVSYFAL